MWKKTKKKCRYENAKNTQDNNNKPAPVNQFMLASLLYVVLKLTKNSK